MHSLVYRGEHDMSCSPFSQCENRFGNIVNLVDVKHFIILLIWADGVVSHAVKLDFTGLSRDFTALDAVGATMHHIGNAPAIGLHKRGVLVEDDNAPRGIFVCSSKAGSKSLDGGVIHIANGVLGLHLQDSSEQDVLALGTAKQSLEIL